MKNKNFFTALATLDGEGFLAKIVAYVNVRHSSRLTEKEAKLQLIMEIQTPTRMAFSLVLYQFSTTGLQPKSYNPNRLVICHFFCGGKSATTEKNATSTPNPRLHFDWF